MANTSEPVVRLDPGGKAFLVGYDVPEPTSYAGRNLIEIDFVGRGRPQSFFLPKAFEKPTTTRPPIRGGDISATAPAVVAAMRSGFADSALFPNVRFTSGVLRLMESPNPGQVLMGPQPLSAELASLDPESVALALQAGKRLSIYRSLYGTLTYCYIDEPKEPDPGIYLVESYRLTSFLGQYGAGRVLSTLSLLPGEKTTISIKTYRRTKTDEKRTTSILDSFTEESAQEFETSVQDEQSNKQEYQKTFEYHAEASGSASWGFGSASASGGVKGSTNSSREEFAKNITSATSKHATRASAKREININTSYEVTDEEGEDTSLTRQIENVNLSRTLNFVFRQMNQEYVTLLHLVDVRVAFFNGFAESRNEVALPEIDSLLEEYIVNSKRAQVRKLIVDALSSIVDFGGKVQTDFTRQRSVAGEKYRAVNTDKKSTYKDGSFEATVPGIIVSRTRNVMRTEGVFVEAILGQANALDAYAQQLQELEVDSREAEVQKQRALGRQHALVNKVVEDGDAQRANLLKDLTCPCGADGSRVHIDVESRSEESESAPASGGATPSPA